MAAWAAGHSFMDGNVRWAFCYAKTGGKFVLLSFPQPFPLPISSFMPFAVAVCLWLTQWLKCLALLFSLFSFLIRKQ